MPDFNQCNVNVMLDLLDKFKTLNFFIKGSLKKIFLLVTNARILQNEKKTKPNHIHKPNNFSLPPKIISWEFKHYKISIKGPNYNRSG